jgi:branched-subunit amino acid transport protein
MIIKNITVGKLARFVSFVSIAILTAIIASKLTGIGGEPMLESYWYVLLGVYVGSMFVWFMFGED